MKAFNILLIVFLPLCKVEGQEYIISVSPDSLQVSIEPDNFNLDKSVSLHLLEDLNQDGLDDQILNFQMCNSLGDCMYGIFIQQRNGKFICVYLPEYWSYFRVKQATTTSTIYKKWKEILVYKRSGKPNADNQEVVKSYSLEFDGKFYVPSIK